MNDVLEPRHGAASRPGENLDVFLQRTRAEVGRMRHLAPRLPTADTATWQELRFGAQTIVAGARLHQLGVLAACAQELANLVDERFGGAAVDARFMLAVTTGIDAIALELAQHGGGS